MRVQQAVLGSLHLQLVCRCILPLGIESVCNNRDVLRDDCACRMAYDAMAVQDGGQLRKGIELSKRLQRAILRQGAFTLLADHTRLSSILHLLSASSHPNQCLSFPR